MSAKSLVLSFLISLMHINVLHKDVENGIFFYPVFYIISHIYFAFHAILLLNFPKLLFQFIEFYCVKYFILMLASFCKINSSPRLDIIGWGMEMDGTRQIALAVETILNVKGSCRSKGFTEIIECFWYPFKKLGQDSWEQFTILLSSLDFFPYVLNASIICYSPCVIKSSSLSNIEIIILIFWTKHILQFLPGESKVLKIRYYVRTCKQNSTHYETCENIKLLLCGLWRHFIKLIVSK